MSKEINKIVLAYSGGLDTSVIIKWLQDEYQAEIIAMVGDVGQQEDLDAIKEKALTTGASRAYVEDLKEDYAYNYVLPTLQAQALYEGKYPLVSSLSRPIISRQMVKIARKENADALAHGCTGKGNDQVRFDTCCRSLTPEMKIIAPLREWEFGSRDEEFDYAVKNGIPVEVSKKNPYSIDKNLWGRCIECGILEDPWQEPPADVFQMTTDPMDAPSEPEYLEIGFMEGVPVSINGEEMGLVELIDNLNFLAGRHGIGRVDMIENRVVGIKSREIYEVPAATVLYMAHRHLEDMVLDRQTSHFKEHISSNYATLAYDGLWFSPLKEAMDAFIGSIQQYVEGVIRIKMYRGQATVVGRKSNRTLYQYQLATYEPEDAFNHQSAEGFIDLFSLPSRVFSEVNGNGELL